MIQTSGLLQTPMLAHRINFFDAMGEHNLNWDSFATNWMHRPLSA